MSVEQNVVVKQSLYQRLIEQIRRYIPTAYIVTLNEIQDYLGL